MNLKEQASNLLKSSIKYLTSFERVDPLNPENLVKGFISRQKGLYGGSLAITHVNGIETGLQPIWGTPKLNYPYKNQDGREFIDFSAIKAHHFSISPKWNGMNILVYKYKDSNDKEFITAKSKGTPFVNNGEVGNFLDLFKEAAKNSPIMYLKTFYGMPEHIQSTSFELCGRKEPHLVSYDFDLELEPLFYTDMKGRIKPYSNATDKFTSTLYLSNVCSVLQEKSFRENQSFRDKNKLPLKYEYNHFATEGYVLYLCDEDGYVINHTMYKIKPKDIEEVHWATFENDYQARVNEAIKKIKASEEAVTETTLQQELDMGPKEWDKFGREVMDYANTISKYDLHLVVLCGLPGSGKSTLAKHYTDKGYIRISQDDLGSRNLCKKEMIDAIRAGKNIIIDRCNFNINQRKTWIDLAKAHGITKISCDILDADPETCLKRVQNRTEHPTLKADNPEIAGIIGGFVKQWEEPRHEEGFVDINNIKTNI